MTSRAVLLATKPCSVVVEAGSICTLQPIGWASCKYCNTGPQLDTLTCDCPVRWSHNQRRVGCLSGGVKGSTVWSESCVGSGVTPGHWVAGTDWAHDVKCGFSLSWSHKAVSKPQQWFCCKGGETTLLEHWVTHTDEHLITYVFFRLVNTAGVTRELLICCRLCHASYKVTYTLSRLLEEGMKLVMLCCSIMVLPD